jgi:hypothetical protein
MFKLLEHCESVIGNRVSVPHLQRWKEQAQACQQLKDPLEAGVIHVLPETLVHVFAVRPACYCYTGPYYSLFTHNLV